MAERFMTLPDIAQRFDPRQARLGAPNPTPPDSTYPARLTWDDVAWLQSQLSIPSGRTHRGLWRGSRHSRAPRTGS